MNFIGQVYVVLVYVGSELYKHIHIIMGVVLAMTISFLKVSNDGKKQICGFLFTLKYSHRRNRY